MQEVENGKERRSAPDGENCTNVLRAKLHTSGDSKRARYLSHQYQPNAKKVREQGIVTISINYNYNENLLLEQQLKSRFKLREAIVVSSEHDQSPEHQLILMAKQCAALLNRIIENGDILGFSWGSAIATWLSKWIHHRYRVS